MAHLDEFGISDGQASDDDEAVVAGMERLAVLRQLEAIEDAMTEDGS